MTIIGSSKTVQILKESLLQASSSLSNVLLLGETGTGKEIAARFIHQNSNRKKTPFIAVNCSAIPENLIESEFFGHEKGSFTGADQLKLGLFEKANKGVLFLDEIGEMDLKLQPKILRAIEERKIRRVGGTSEIDIDVRIISATHRDLKERVEKNLFREDLFYRLNVHPINIPPLRQRREDIPELVKHFVQRHDPENKITVHDSFTDALMGHHFEGNIRELQNIVERSLLNAKDGALGISALPMDIWMPPKASAKNEESSTLDADLEDIFSDLSLSEMVDNFERELISRALAIHGGNTEIVAKRLKISRSTLYSKLSKFGLK
jgi:two-component system, NtrC family, response regulator AtoC